MPDPAAEIARLKAKLRAVTAAADVGAFVHTRQFATSREGYVAGVIHSLQSLAAVAVAERNASMNANSIYVTRAESERRNAKRALAALANLVKAAKAGPNDARGHDLTAALTAAESLLSGRDA